VVSETEREIHYVDEFGMSHNKYLNTSDLDDEDENEEEED
jgi:hypothetical protein